jgi:hypothetical protein
MDPKQRTYLIIGDGHVARHFCHYFSMAKIPFFHWYRQTEDSIPPLNKYISQSDVALLLISDDAIEDFLRAHPALETIPCCHFSGSHISNQAHGCHPLMTFHKTLYSLEKYESVPFVFEEGFDFDRFFPELKNPRFSLPRDQRPLYHALCVMAGNFSMLLWDKLFRDFELKLGLPRNVAYPYLQQVSENLISQNDLPLTGPLARRDTETIKNNIGALKGDAFKEVYEAFLSAYAQISAAKEDSQVILSRGTTPTHQPSLRSVKDAEVYQ